jgi:YD repeat-containing protein
MKLTHRLSRAITCLATALVLASIAMTGYAQELKRPILGSYWMNSYDLPRQMFPSDVALCLGEVARVNASASCPSKLVGWSHECGGGTSTRSVSCWMITFYPTYTSAPAQFGGGWQYEFCPPGFNLKEKFLDPNSICSELDMSVPPYCSTTMPDKLKCEHCPATGNPIGIGTGTKLHREVLVQGKSHGLGLDLFYNSDIGFDPYTAQWLKNDNPSASAWRHTYERAIRVSGVQGGLVGAYVIRETGRLLSFASTAGSWIGDADIADTLTELKDGSGVRIGWTYKVSADGSQESYDAAGRLIAVTQVNGSHQTLAYDLPTADGGDGNPYTLDTVTDDVGRQLHFTHDASGRLATAKDSAGSVFTLGYDAQSNLVSVAHTDGSSRTYQYNEPTYTGGARLPNALTGITDENGVRYATYVYNSSGQAIKEWHAGDVDKNQLTYNGISTVVTDPLGTQRTYNFTTILGVVKSTGQSQPGGSGCGPSSSVMTYDTNGNVTSRTDFANHKTCYAYDLARNLETERVEGLASSSVCATVLTTPPAPTAANPVRTISTIWHPDWRLEVKRAEPKKLTTWVYNGQPDPSQGGATASCAPADALLPDGKPTAVLCKKIEQATTDATGASGFAATVTGTPRTWTWTYTRYGQMLTADGPRTDVNDVTTYTYYDATDAEMGRRGNLASITDALGHITQFTSYDLNGRVTSITDPNGVYTDFTYDLRGRLASKAVGGETTHYTYDPVGQLTQVSLPDGTSLTYTYDPAHRLTAITDGVGNKIQFTLDAMGNRTKEEVFDPEGLLVRAQIRAYDALGRLQNLVHPQ